MKSSRGLRRILERYVVIDDEDDELDELPLFQPSARTGLSDEIVDGVVAYLTGRTDKDMRRSRLKRVFQKRLHRHQRARRIEVVERRRRARNGKACLQVAPEWRRAWLRPVSLLPRRVKRRGLRSLSQPSLWTHRFSTQFEHAPKRSRRLVHTGLF
jgi:hypothetical protein